MYPITTEVQFAIREGANKIISSAYRMMLRYVKPKWQPWTVAETCVVKSSIKIENRQGEIAPHYLTPVNCL